jgi:hypothetical protein
LLPPCGASSVTRTYRTPFDPAVGATGLSRLRSALVNVSSAAVVQVVPSGEVSTR